MGIALEAWRAAIGTFRSRHSGSNFIIPKQCFYSNWSHFTKRNEWNRYLIKCKQESQRSFRSNCCIGFIILSWYIQCAILTSGDVHPNPGPAAQDYHNVKICHSNIRSVKQKCDNTGSYIKFEHIKCHLASMFDIITVSEMG